MDAVQQKVNNIIADQLGLKIDSIKPDSNFVNDLGADSLDTVELVMALEEAFNMEISDEDAEQIKTVSDVYKYINSKLEQKK